MGAPEQRTDRNGRPYFLVTEHELRQLPGWRWTHTKGRGPCPFHGGDNPSACVADLTTGDVRCWTHGCYGRMSDHPATKAGGRPAWKPWRWTATATAAAPVKPDASRTATEQPTTQQLRHADELRRWQSLLTDSPAVDWWAQRGIPLELLEQVGAGWCPGEPSPTPARAGGSPHHLSGRCVFPVTNESGAVIQLYGRRVTDGPSPKWLGSHGARGRSAWFRLQDALEDGPTLVVVESVGNALALLAAGVRGVFATMGTAGFPTVPWELLDGRRLIVVGDRDVAGWEATAKTLGAAPLDLELIPATCPELPDKTDVGDWWREQRTLPPSLVALLEQPERPSRRAASPASATATDVATILALAAAYREQSDPELLQTDREVMDAGSADLEVAALLMVATERGLVLPGVTAAGVPFRVS